MNPFVFIVGCPRSGTTLLRRVVDAHPRIAVTPETHWIPEWFEKRIALTAKALEHASRIRHAFSHDLRSRGRRLPANLRPA